MSPKSAPPPSQPQPKATEVQSFRVAGLSTRKPTRFDFRPDAGLRAGIAANLGLIALPAFRLKGEIAATGKRDFHLSARMTADIVQACSITLAPVPATLSEDISRKYIGDWVEPPGDDVEMPEDDSAEPLPEVIDLIDVATEALALSLPLYPRAPGAELPVTSFAPPGAEPIRDEDLKPFAGLAALRNKLGTRADGE